MGTKVGTKWDQEPGNKRRIGNRRLEMGKESFKKTRNGFKKTNLGKDPQG